MMKSLGSDVTACDVGKRAFWLEEEETGALGGQRLDFMEGRCGNDLIPLKHIGFLDFPIVNGAYVKDQYALDLLDKMLTIDPAKRIDCDTTLGHDFFWTDPLPCDFSKMLEPHTRSMFEFLYSRNKDHVKHPVAGPYSRPHPTGNDGQYHDRVF
ncbi:Cyclin-dependent kinase 9 [Araneus ventricosus]|uniref:Cyclin-dependent kinase 9 n=1 Tax=Araneus ventricosus TaxID=182803 RepID=A0A4Y2IP32_ARAVE|nr:Cyclin-dependent kinase 9 [Araneus ventricosus]